MKILDLKDGKVIISAEALGIPEFNVLYTRDTSKSKSKALAELSYVFYMCDFDSPYANFSDERKTEMLGEDLFKNPKYKPDEHVNKAIDKYKRLSETPISRLLRAIEDKTDELATYMRNTKLDSTTLKEVLEVMKSAAPLVTNAGVLRREAEKEQKVKGKVRGAIEIGDYER